ncbi:MAG: hypothetical protein ABWZ85_01150 [Luteibacter sp.]|jgi:hypothetical protein
MSTSPVTAMRRIASTIFVFFALLVACVGVGASPCAAGVTTTAAAQDHAAQHALAVADDTASVDDQDAVPSLEDNSGGGLDDSFDVPPEHLVSVPHSVAARPAGLVPPPHAHHPRLDLRPPIR